MDPLQPKSSKKGLIAGIVALLVIAGGGYTFYRSSGVGNIGNDQPTSGNPVTPTDTTSGTPVTTAPTYKDGTYTADGNYLSPGGAESITVTLTLKDNIVTDATVISHATIANSIHYQGVFIANYKPLVIGKDISTLNLTKVSGSSLTPKGFNDAVAKIKVQAQA